MISFEHPLSAAEKQRWLDFIFAKREPLDDAQLWERRFKDPGVALDTVERVRRILGEILEVDLSKIRAGDGLSKQLSFLWDVDSLADLKLVHALEEEFKISISDAEAAAMKTFQDIVFAVHAKITAVRPAVVPG